MPGVGSSRMPDSQWKLQYATSHRRVFTVGAPAEAARAACLSLSLYLLYLFIFSPVRETALDIFSFILFFLLFLFYILLFSFQERCRRFPFSLFVSLFVSIFFSHPYHHCNTSIIDLTNEKGDLREIDGTDARRTFFVMSSMNFY